ncbi:DNA polymerase III subunit delta' [Selenomonas sp. oral taxon 126]|uniref:DNA polymerase III subunit delta' n=1 Tax=Selenomonas sp. oral taxon 126 TaxID=712528 RepID=UPI0008079A17|nr:DNA polymerase III subunit delta' [Selenomonas sp. oral taxon 126]ANR70577.1 DNA polymerase III subunit delta' [Selenomonas sp. oral taxon 126]
MARAKKSVSAAPSEAVREDFPEGWADIRGHGEIIRRLRALAVTRRLPHALLFCGTEGVGKRRTARVLARTLLCAAGGDAPCGQCDSCRTMATGVHPDYFEVAPEARGKSAAMIRTDAVRDILIAASGAPIAAERRIILIDGADRMNEAAANRLLKTLEEPPGAVLFILVTNAYDAILPTIRSRAVRIAFGALPRTEITAALAARGSEHAAAIASLADGSLGRAYALTEEGLALRDDALDLLAQLPNLGVEDIWARAEALGARPHAERTAWISYVQMALRDLLLLREDGGSDALCHIDRRETLTALLAYMADSDIFALMDGAREFSRRFAANVNPALQAEAFLLRARKQFI